MIKHSAFIMLSSLALATLSTAVNAGAALKRC